MKRVGLVFGGPSEEHNVSLVSAKCILQALNRTKWKPVLLGISKKGDWFLQEEKDLLTTELDKPFDVARGELVFKRAPNAAFQPKLSDLKLDVVFPIVHGTFGEDGTLQGVLETVGVPYVGCGVAASALCMDKETTKILLAHHALPIVPFITLYSQETPLSFESTKEKLGLPLFVKPSSSGSSVGVSKVTRPEEWPKALEEAFKWGPKVLVESAITGVEVEVAVKGKTEIRASLPGTFKTQANFYSYEAKYLGKDSETTFTVPAFDDESKIRELQNLAIKAFRVIGGEGLARVDFFHTDEGKIYLNEINTLPGFTPISMYPMLWEKSGLSYSDLIDELLESA